MSTILLFVKDELSSIDNPKQEYVGIASSYSTAYYSTKRYRQRFSTVSTNNYYSSRHLEDNYYYSTLSNQENENDNTVNNLPAFSGVRHIVFESKSDYLNRHNLNHRLDQSYSYRFWL